MCIYVCVCVCMSIHVCMCVYVCIVYTVYVYVYNTHYNIGYSDLPYISNNVNMYTYIQYMYIEKLYR